MATTTIEWPEDGAVPSFQPWQLQSNVDYSRSAEDRECSSHHHRHHCRCFRRCRDAQRRCSASTMTTAFAVAPAAVPSHRQHGRQRWSCGTGANNEHLDLPPSYSHRHRSWQASGCGPLRQILQQTQAFHPQLLVPGAQTVTISTGSTANDAVRIWQQMYCGQCRTTRSFRRHRPRLLAFGRHPRRPRRPRYRPPPAQTGTLRTWFSAGRAAAYGLRSRDQQGSHCCADQRVQRPCRPPTRSDRRRLAPETAA